LSSTSIKQVITIIGEPQFDHVIGLCKPARGETVLNLPSKEALKENGTPVPRLTSRTGGRAG